MAARLVARPRPRLARLTAALLGALGLILGGTACQMLPDPMPPADDALAALVEGLQTGSLAAVPFVGSAAEADEEYQTIIAAMDEFRPAVTVTTTTYDQAAKTGLAELRTSYPVASAAWTYDTTVELTYDAETGWHITWSPAIVHPRLDGYTRLSITSSSATRGNIVAYDGTTLVWNRPVYKVGIDKTRVSGEAALQSAWELASLVGVDPEAFMERVKNGGEKEFVVAITLREGQVPIGVDDIDGVLTQAGVASLGPSPTWGISLLGTAGEVTAEDIDNSGGVLQVGDVVGKSGLQARYDTFLRGQLGYTVWLAPRAPEAVVTPAPTSGPEPTPMTERQRLWGIDPTPGGNLTLTLDSALQTKAEEALLGQPGIAALVALDLNTGAIRAAANSPAAGANPYATQGQYAPGSTFKIATALAGLRTGLTPDSMVECPATTAVGTASFKNYGGYPPSGIGTITLREAIAWSCNTAMVNISRTLSDTALPDAAASLGLGNQADLGFAGFLGSVLVADSDTERAMNSFGQGNTIVSPLAMATEVASVAAGRTITPYLVEPVGGTSAEPTATTSSAPGGPPTATPTSSAPPLSPEEAAALQDMMQAVVTIGTATNMRDYVTGAKSGTAEYIEDGKILTHAWMIAYNDTYAIAAFVMDGVAGGASAGPLIEALLS